MFKALVLRKTDSIRAKVEEMSLSSLEGHGDVLVQVHWSGINYKDALAVTGRAKIVRGDYPFVPGIDLAGTILESESPDFQIGQRVLATGWGVGEDYWGGFAQIQRVASTSLIHIPEGLSERDAMTFGTAGLTAMLSAMELEQVISADKGEVLVTGATGGVGSFSVLALSHFGFNVVAVSGKQDSEPYLQRLGASRVIAREVFAAGAKKPLDSGLWAGCIDCVGSTTLEAILSQIKRHGVVAACGLAGGHTLNTTVFPFILRGIRLIGIDSNTCPNNVRVRAWELLSELASNFNLYSISHETGLDGIVEYSERLMAGSIKGRIVVKLT